jgi:SAM-dependent methyltransferase
VAVGQAFHWFDGDAALAEIHRVLRPGGALALVWNRRLLENPVNRAIEAIIAPHHGYTPAHRPGAWRAPFERTSLFGPLEEREFPNAQTLDAQALAARVASISFIATLPASERERVLGGYPPCSAPTAASRPELSRRGPRGVSLALYAYA